MKIEATTFADKKTEQLARLLGAEQVRDILDTFGHDTGLDLLEIVVKNEAYKNRDLLIYKDLYRNFHKNIPYLLISIQEDASLCLKRLEAIKTGNEVNLEKFFQSDEYEDFTNAINILVEVIEHLNSFASSSTEVRRWVEREPSKQTVIDRILRLFKGKPTFGGKKEDSFAEFNLESIKKAIGILKSNSTFFTKDKIASLLGLDSEKDFASQVNNLADLSDVSPALITHRHDIGNTINMVSLQKQILDLGSNVASVNEVRQQITSIVSFVSSTMAVHTVHPLEEITEIKETSFVYLADIVEKQAIAMQTIHNYPTTLTIEQPVDPTYKLHISFEWLTTLFFNAFQNITRATEAINDKNQIHVSITFKEAVVDGIRGAILVVENTQSSINTPDGNGQSFLDSAEMETLNLTAEKVNSGYANDAPSTGVGLKGIAETLAQFGIKVQLGSFTNADNLGSTRLETFIPMVENNLVQ